jgi:putative transposase
MAWTETEYHRRVHTETGQPPLDRWGAGWDRVGRTPAIPSADDLTEAFLWEVAKRRRRATRECEGNVLG